MDKFTCDTQFRFIVRAHLVCWETAGTSSAIRSESSHLRSLLSFQLVSKQLRHPAARPGHSLREAGARTDRLFQQPLLRHEQRSLDGGGHGRQSQDCHHRACAGRQPPCMINTLYLKNETAQKGFPVQRFPRMPVMLRGGSACCAPRCAEYGQ